VVEQIEPKVFCIGFHKTGTTSLTKALSQLGYRVVGWPSYSAPMTHDTLHATARKLMECFDAFQDNPWPLLFKLADELYPGSKFILTTRDPDNWINSAIKHFGADETPMRELIYGLGLGSPKGNEEHYKSVMQAHNKNVLDYFIDRPQDLLVMDISDGDGWQKVCTFLSKPIPDTPFPHENRASSRAQTEAPGNWAKHAFVVGRNKQDLFHTARMTDFSLSPAVSLKSLNLKRLVPYASDFSNGDILYAATCRSQLDDPFLYVSQFQNADYVARIRARDVLRVATESPAGQPTFVFSIGRCGSTLTSNISKALGLPTFSEPDALVGPGVFKPDQPDRLVMDVLKASVMSMQHFAGRGDITIKMRAYSNIAVGWFTETFPEARFVFLYRRFEPWVKSYVKAFDLDVETLFFNLSTGVQAHRFLSQNGHLSALVSYEELTEDPISSAEKIFGHSLNEVQISAVRDELAHDSQQGIVKQNDFSREDIERRIEALRDHIGKSPMGPIIQESDILRGMQ